MTGYASFILGVVAFSRKSDRQLKLFNSIQALAYGLHFLLLGNLPASGSALVSSVRSYLAIRSRSRVLATIIVAINVAVGIAFVHSKVGWLPVIGACSSTLAIFFLGGVPLRLVLLFATFCWLVNNFVSHSIGGTLLELVIATVSITTIIRLLRAQRTAVPAAEAAGQEVDA